MADKEPGFWADFAGRIGAPIFATTLVARLLSNRFELIHGALAAVGLLPMGISHRSMYHR